jgi:peptide-methionine (R)-S-oxide reductase
MIANIFMAEIDERIKKCGYINNKNLVHFYKRYIDDIFIIWTGTNDEFTKFTEEINNLHQTIKFTKEYDQGTRSTTFLDMTITITANNKIKTDLYRKETDKVQYLLPSSCHPSHTFKSVPYSLALRLVRICSDKEDLQKRFKELEEMLISRNYNKNIIKNSIEKASQLDRSEIIKKVVKTPSDRVVLALTYHPKLPSVSNIIKKHWPTMSKDQNTKEMFPLPPMIAFKQSPNLKSKLCQAKLPNSRQRQQRLLTGIKPCNKPCGICPYILKSNEFISTNTKERFKMTGNYTCSTKGVIYLTTCSKCLQQYVGQTGRRLMDRMKEHLNSICLQKEVTGIHYNSTGHNSSNFQVQIIERVTPNTPNYRLEREELWIKRLVTKTPHGLNKQD